MDYIEATRFANRNLCAVCGGGLSLFPAGAEGYEVRCPRPGHTGVAKEESWTAAWKRGEAIPIEIANRLERKFGGERLETKALVKLERLEMERRIGIASRVFGFVVEETGLSRAPNTGEVILLVDYCLTYGFDPLLNEICIFQGRPYPMIDGLRRKAHETGEYRGLKMEPVTDPTLKVSLGYGEGDTIFKATVRKSEGGELAEFERYGGVARWEVEEMSRKTPTRHRYPVLAKRTSDMAQNRAERDALRAAFQFSYPGIESLPGVVEGTFTEFTPQAPQKTEVPQEQRDLFDEE